eukprot:4119942-Prymnesium_polylepis.1
MTRTLRCTAVFELHDPAPFSKCPRAAGARGGHARPYNLQPSEDNTPIQSVKFRFPPQSVTTPHPEWRLASGVSLRPRNKKLCVLVLLTFPGAWGSYKLWPCAPACNRRLSLTSAGDNLVWAIAEGAASSQRPTVERPSIKCALNLPPHYPPGVGTCVFTTPTSW